MIFDINEDYRVRTDSLNYILEERITITKRETEEEVPGWKILGFYGSVPMALRALPGVIVMRPETTTFLELLTRFESVMRALQAHLPKTS